MAKITDSVTQSAPRRNSYFALNNSRHFIFFSVYTKINEVFCTVHQLSIRFFLFADQASCQSLAFIEKKIVNYFFGRGKGLFILSLSYLWKNKLQRLKAVKERFLPLKLVVMWPFEYWHYFDKFQMLCFFFIASIILYCFLNLNFGRKTVVYFFKELIWVV